MKRVSTSVFFQTHSWSVVGISLKVLHKYVSHVSSLSLACILIYHFSNCWQQLIYPLFTYHCSCNYHITHPIDLNFETCLLWDFSLMVTDNLLHSWYSISNFTGNAPLTLWKCICRKIAIGLLLFPIKSFNFSNTDFFFYLGKTGFSFILLTTFVFVVWVLSIPKIHIFCLWSHFIFILEM